MSVSLGVLSLKIGGKRLHQDTQGDTQTSTKPNTTNNTGALDIFSVRLSRRKQWFNLTGTESKSLILTFRSK